MAWYPGPAKAYTGAGTETGDQYCVNMYEGTLPATIQLHGANGNTVPAAASWEFAETITGDRVQHAVATSAGATSLTLPSGLPHGCWRLLPKHGNGTYVDDFEGRILWMPAPEHLAQFTPNFGGGILQFMAGTSFGIGRFKPGPYGVNFNGTNLGLRWEEVDAPPQLVKDIVDGQDNARPVPFHASRARRYVMSLIDGKAPFADYAECLTKYPWITDIVLCNEPGSDQDVPVGRYIVPWARWRAEALWAMKPSLKIYAPMYVSPTQTDSWLRESVSYGLFDPWTAYTDPDTGAVLNGSGGRVISPATHLYNYSNLPEFRIQLDSFESAIGNKVADIGGHALIDEHDTHWAMQNGMGAAARQLQTFMFTAVEMERRGWMSNRVIPWEGYWGFPSFIGNRSGQPFPIMGGIRRFADETVTCGKPDALGAGGMPEEHVALTCYTRPDGSKTIVAVTDGLEQADGPLKLKVKLTGTNPGTLVNRNYAGRTLTPVVVDGSNQFDLTVPIGGPSYTRLPAGVTAEVATKTWTLQNGGATAWLSEWNGTQYVKSSTGVAGVPARTPLTRFWSGRFGSLQNGLYADRSVLITNVVANPTHPVYWGVDFSRAKWVGAVQVSSMVAYAEQSAILSGFLEYHAPGDGANVWTPVLQNGAAVTWDNVPTIIHKKASTQEGTGDYFEVQGPIPSAWHIVFDARVWIDGIRVGITKHTAGGAPEAAAVDGYGSGGSVEGAATWGAAIQRFRAYDVTDTVSNGSTQGYMRVAIAP